MPCGDQHKYFHLFRYLKRRMSLLNCLTSSTRCWSRRLVRGKWAEIIFSRFWHLSGLAWSWSSPRFYFLSIQHGPLLIFKFLKMITSAAEADHPWSSIFRISLSEIKEHDWVTMYGLNPLLKEEENCQLIEVRQWSGKDYWKGKGWWKSFFQKNVLKFLKLFSRWPSTRCRTASAPSPSLTLLFWSR